MFASFYRCCQRIPAHIAALQHQIEQLMGSGGNAFVARTDVCHLATIYIDIIRSLPTCSYIQVQKYLFVFAFLRINGEHGNGIQICVDCFTDKLCIRLGIRKSKYLPIIVNAEI